MPKPEEQKSIQAYHKHQENVQKTPLIQKWFPDMAEKRDPHIRRNKIRNFQ